MAESTEIQPRERETHETLRLTDSQLAALTPRARELIRQSGFGGLRQLGALVRESTSLERNLHFQAVYAEKNAQREMGIVTVDSESAIVENDESAHLSEELAAARAENDELREKIERQERENRVLHEGIAKQGREIERLTVKFAESAIAVNAEPSQR